MERRVRTSLARSFTTVSLLMILIVKLILSLIFFVYLRSVVINLTEEKTKNKVAYSKEMIVTGMIEQEQALNHAAVGIAHLFRQPNITVEETASFLHDITNKLPNIHDVYFTNNSVWNQAGGFAAFGSRWIPSDDWDNTSRLWFTEAKKSQGGIVYSRPYVDADTGDIVVTLSMSVYNGSSDIGVIAADVTVNKLWDIINSVKDYTGQEIYLINADGLYITHEDTNAIMEDDIFNAKNLKKYRSSVLNETEFMKIDKNQFIYSSFIPRTKSILVSVIPSSSIFASTNLFTIRLIIFSILIFICVTIVTIIFTHRNITVPLSDAVAASDALAKNDFNIHITKFRNDEIGALQDSLIRIRDSLKSNIDSLQKHYIDKE